MPENMRYRGPIESSKINNFIAITTSQIMSIIEDMNQIHTTLQDFLESSASTQATFAADTTQKESR